MWILHSTARKFIFWLAISIPPDRDLGTAGIDLWWSLADLVIILASCIIILAKWVIILA